MKNLWDVLSSLWAHARECLRSQWIGEKQAQEDGEEGYIKSKADCIQTSCGSVYLSGQA